jgi:hypothetical protein
MWRLLRKLLPWRTYPIHLVGDILLTGIDRGENWYLSKGDRCTQIYAPSDDLWGRKVLFCGVTSERWNAPYQHELITTGDKRLLEHALAAYLERDGVTLRYEDPTEPVRQVIDTGP